MWLVTIMDTTPRAEGGADIVGLPEHEVGGLRQVYPQEGKVNLGHVGQLRHRRDNLVMVQEHILGHLELLVSVIQHVSIQQVGDHVELILGHVQQIGQRLPDDGVQHHQKGQGKEGPETAGGGLDPFLLIEPLQLLAIFHPVPGVLLL